MMIMIYYGKSNENSSRNTHDGLGGLKGFHDGWLLASHIKGDLTI